MAAGEEVRPYETLRRVCSTEEGNRKVETEPAPTSYRLGVEQNSSGTISPTLRKGTGVNVHLWNNARWIVR